MSAVATQRKPLSTSDLHAMARAGRSWEFLALAARVEVPDDALILLMSASCARLGLATFAAELASDLSPTVLASPQGVSLVAAISKLPSDAVSLSRREALLTENQLAMAGLGLKLEDHVGAWRERAGAVETFEGFDGSIVRRARGAHGIDSVCFTENRGAAKDLMARSAGLKEAYCAPIVVHGISPPWVFLEVFHATNARPHGYAPRIMVLQEDPLDFLDALSAVSAGAMLSDPRVEVLVGLDAAQQLRESMRRRRCEQIEPLLLSWSRAGEPLGDGAIESVIDEELRAQGVETTRLIEATDAHYASLPDGYFERRFAEAAAGRGEPLRVLIPTCRFSTFVKHSSADLAAALRRAGHVAEVLAEPRDDARLSVLAYREAVHALKPDLVVLVNYPRACMGDSIPTGVPYVCWIQDSMPHLYDARVGASHGPLDFLMGHVFGNLFDDFNYPIERAMPAAVVADPAKFHEGAIEPALLARHACEIAMVTHHSETPDAMHARLCRETTNDPGIRTVMERVRIALPSIVENVASRAASPAIASLVAHAAREVLGSGVPAKSLEQLTRHYAMPLADRMVRHQTLQWAAELCNERGWRLHLYGKGWDKHPTLARYARGALAHDEELRAAYRGATVHLHAALCSLVHQRVAECSLSGGVCLGRVTYESLAPYHATCSARLVQEAPDAVDEEGKRYGYIVEGHQSLLERADLHERLGLPRAMGMVYMSFARHAAFVRKASIVGADADPCELFGDLAATTYWSRETFRGRMVRAIEDPAWREETRREMRERVVARFTSDVLVKKVLGLVQRGLRGVRGVAATGAAA